MLQLADRLGFDLANALARDVELFADFFERVVGAHLDAETHAQHLGFAWCQAVEMSTDHTLEEVGKQFDVTRERIRQIEAKAIRKLKHPSRSDKLRTYLDTL